MTTIPQQGNYPNVPPPPTFDLQKKAGRASRAIWLDVLIILIAILIGGGWDAWYHTTHPFDGFFSPPHVFVYSCCVLAGLVATSMYFRPDIRTVLSRTGTIEMPWLPWPVPGSLFIMGGGIVLAGIAGLVFDNLWHTLFGLDETTWTFPHAMIGWSELVFTLGVVSCVLAVRQYRRARSLTTFFLGLCVGMASSVPFMGPLIQIRSTLVLRTQIQHSILATQPPALHLLRIVTEWNLTRSNPLLILLAPVWAGAFIAFLRELDQRWWMLLLITGISTWMDDGQATAHALNQLSPGLSSNQVNWISFPLVLPALIIVILTALRSPEVLTYGSAALIFAMTITREFGTAWIGWIFVMVAPLTMLLGRRIGRGTYALLHQPDSPGAVVAIFGAGIALPAATGIIDLALRAITP